MADRRAHLRVNYGITETHYRWLFKKQHGRCAICGRVGPRSRWGRFFVDHDHKTGAVRGLLCMDCNTGLGKFDESLRRLNKAKRYIKHGGLAKQLTAAGLPAPRLKLKLNCAKAAAIRAINGTVSQEKIGRKFRVSQAAISAVVRKQIWKC